MQYFFSRSTQGFYCEAIHGTAMPDDAVAITSETYAAMMAAQTRGLVIQGTTSGQPVAVASPPPTGVLAQAILKSAALAALTASDVTATRCFKAGVPFPAPWIAYTQALRVIVEHPESSLILPDLPAYPVGT